MYNDHLQLKNNKKPIKYIKIKKLKKKSYFQRFIQFQRIVLKFKNLLSNSILLRQCFHKYARLARRPAQLSTGSDVASGGSFWDRFLFIFSCRVKIQHTVEKQMYFKLLIPRRSTLAEVILQILYKNNAKTNASSVAIIFGSFLNFRFFQIKDIAKFKKSKPYHFFKVLLFSKTQVQYCMAQIKGMDETIKKRNK